MQIKKLSKMLLLYVCSVALSVSVSLTDIFAKITGPCANCHTMHNSQDGSPVASGGPYAVLLVNNCIGCHSATNQATGIDATTGAPIVYNINGAPTYGVATQGLAGGNFYWVPQVDDTKGHNGFPGNQDDNLSENMILSTCNRVEIYAISQQAEKGVLDLKDFLSRFHNLPLINFEKSLYFLVGEEAVRHIFRVASSLDSMVVGEPQILGKIKAAYTMATESNTSGVILHRLLHRAFHVAKTVRSETRIGDSAVSVSSVAVELDESIFGSLEQRSVLLIAAGEMCELAARHLVAGGAGKILVTNRTYERAVSLAREFNGKAIPFDELGQGLKRADIVISATDASQYLINHDQMVKVMKERKQRPIFFIDIADPRDIAPGSWRY